MLLLALGPVAGALLAEEQSVHWHGPATAALELDAVAAEWAPLERVLTEGRLEPARVAAVAHFAHDDFAGEFVAAEELRDERHLMWARARLVADALPPSRFSRVPPLAPAERPALGSVAVCFTADLPRPLRSGNGAGSLTILRSQTRAMPQGFVGMRDVAAAVQQSYFAIRNGYYGVNAGSISSFSLTQLFIRNAARTPTWRVFYFSNRSSGDLT